MKMMIWGLRITLVVFLAQGFAQHSAYAFKHVKGKEALEYVGDIKAKFTNGKYSYEILKRSQRDAMDLTRRLATAPRDVAGFYASSVRSLTDAQGRVLDLTRQLIDELGDGQREGRDTIRKVIEANRDAGQAAIEATRDTVNRAGSAVENVRGSVRRRTSSNNRAREATETKTS